MAIDTDQLVERLAAIKGSAVARLERLDELGMVDLVGFLGPRLGRASKRTKEIREGVFS